MGVRGQLVIRICKMTFPRFECFVELSFGLYYSKQSTSSFFTFFLVLFSGRTRKERLWKCSDQGELQEGIFHQKTIFPHSCVSYLHSYTLDNLSFFSPFPFFHHSSCFLEIPLHCEAKAPMLYNSHFILCASCPWSFSMQWYSLKLS